VETTFVRGALDKMGVEPQIEQRHEYKNAADVLTRTEMTPAHREALERLTASVFEDAVAEIAADRQLDVDRVRELIDTAPLLSNEARDAGLVDRLGYRDEAYAALRARVPAKAQLLFADRWHPPRRPHWPRRRQGHVALIEARGGISSGRSRRGAFGRQIGSDSVGAQLRAVLADERARALVMHVDSPGGSAVASEVIWREVSRVRDAGKPVIISMGDVAGSGGYYISCGADVIVALPATVTGSIGVLSGKFVTAELMERLGLTTGTVEQGDRALMYSARRRFDEGEQARLAATVDAIYRDFVGKVAQGRGRSYEEIEPLARGRVWTGRDALERGLVDQLGGLREAVGVARSRAGLRDDAPVVPAVHLPWFARLGRPRNSEDPRALAATTLPGLGDLASALGGLDAGALRMPPIRLR
jgi:protease-4